MKATRVWSLLACKFERVKGLRFGDGSPYCRGAREMKYRNRERPLEFGFVINQACKWGVATSSGRFLW